MDYQTGALKKVYTRKQMSSVNLDQKDITGIVPKEERKSMATAISSSSVIDPLAFQMMIVGTIIMPVTPKIIEKIGNRKTAILSMLIQGISLIVLFVGPYENIAFDFVILAIYGLGYIAGPCGSCMMIDAIDDFDDKYGVRNDGMAFSIQGTATKVATAIGVTHCSLWLWGHLVMQEAWR